MGLQRPNSHSARRLPGRRYFAAFASAAVLAALGAPAAAQAGSGQLQVTAMSYNLFQGSELTDAASATTPAQLLAAVATDYGQVQATNFPERAQAIAAQAESANPDLIGVQEAALWQTGAFSATYPPPPPTTVSYDFVKILVNALAAHGLHYAPVAVTNNFTIAGPGLFPSGFMNVQLTDRVAILARTDVPLTITNAQTGNYTHNAVLNTFQGPITLTGGWAAVDADPRRAHPPVRHHPPGPQQRHRRHRPSHRTGQRAAGHNPAGRADLRLQRHPRHGHLPGAHRRRAEGLLDAGANRRTRIHLLPKPHPAQPRLHARVPDRLHLQPRRRAHRR